jgi:putative heme transporter
MSDLSHQEQTAGDAGEPASGPVKTGHPSRTTHIIRGAISLAVVIAIFALIIPKIASYSSVWKTLTKLTSVQLAAVIGAMIFNLFTYWWQMQAAMPGLTMWQAAVNNQTGTTISNLVPGGGVIALGLVVEMFRSWGFTGSQIALEISTTGIWNSFLKLGLPIVALALLAVTGKATTALLIPALVGVAILLGAILLFALMLRKKEFARAVGNSIGAAWSRVRRLFGKPAVTGWGETAVKFRKATIKLVAKRWIPLTLTTIGSHLALFFVLLLSLRYVGVSGNEVSCAQALAVFAFARLLSAAPITPGGVGFVELALIAGLYAAGRHHVDVPLGVFKAQVTAATLLFRLLTYGIQIPLGGFTYIIWRRNRRWRREAPPEPAGELQGVAP